MELVTFARTVSPGIYDRGFVLKQGARLHRSATDHVEDAIGVTSLGFREWRIVLRRRMG